MVGVFGVPAWRSRSFRDGCRWFYGEFGEAFEVLGGGGEEELVVGAAKPPEPEALEAHVTLQVGEQHLDLLAFLAGSLVGLRPHQ